MAQLNKALFSSTKEDWATPQDFFDKLDEEFHFDLDPCADAENAKCKENCTNEETRLLKDWGGALRLLQSTIRPKNNGRMDPEVLRRSEEARNGCRCAYSGTH